MQRFKINDPFQNPPPYEKLVGDLAGAYSRRINIPHRLIYQVFQWNQGLGAIDYSVSLSRR